jgi:hypothetical protein
MSPETSFGEGLSERNAREGKIVFWTLSFG